MQIQQVLEQNKLLQQLVQTLQRQIQSKNQQQNIMIQELEHVIKDNDNIMTKYSILLNDNRKWSEKQRYYEKTIKEMGETLNKSQNQLHQARLKLASQSQSNINVVNPLTHGNSHSAPQIQAINPLIFNNKVPIPMHVTAQLYGSIPKINPSNGNNLQHQSHSQGQLIQNINSIQSDAFSSNQSQSNYSPKAAQYIQKIQTEMKCLKSLSESLKLQLTKKDLQLKSKNQKLQTSSKDLHELEDQIQNLKDQIEGLRKQNVDLNKHLDQKYSEIQKNNQEKDKQFFQIYEQINEEWRQKYEKIQQDKNTLQFKVQDYSRQLIAKDEESSSLRDNINFLSKKNEDLTGQIQEISKQRLSLIELKKNCETEVNLKNNQIQSLKSQIQNLKRQSQQISKRKQQSESILAQNKIIQNNSIENELKLVQQKQVAIKQLQQQIAQQCSQIKAIKSSYESQKLEVTKKQMQVKSKNQKLTQLGKQVQFLVEEVQNLKDYIAQLSKDLEEKQKQIQEKDQNTYKIYKEIDDEWRAKCDQLAQDKKTLDCKADEYMKQLEQKSVQIEQIKKDFQKLITINQEIQKEIQNITTEKQSILQQKNKLFAALSERDINVDQLKNQLNNQKNENLEIIDIKNKVEEQLKQNLNKLLSFEQNQKNYKQKIQQLQSKTSIQVVASENNSTSQAFKQLETENNELRSQLNQLFAQFCLIGKQIQENVPQKFQSLMNQKTQQINQLKSQLQEISSDLTKKQQERSEILAMLALKDQQHSELSRQIDQLNKQNEGRGKLFESNNSSSQKQLMKNSNYVSWQVFEKISSEYAELQDELNEAKAYQDQFVAKQKQLEMLKRRYDDLTKLFTQRAEQIKLKQSIEDDSKRQSMQIQGFKKSLKGNQKIMKTSQTVQNFVEQNFSSARSHDQRKSDEIIQDENISNNGSIGMKVSPSERKSDLPLHNKQFADQNKQILSVRPKSNYIEEMAKQAKVIPNQIDINYLRTSIAEFGMDIDFNSIAKHIGFDIEENEKQEQEQIGAIKQVRSENQGHQAYREDDDVLRSGEGFGYSKKEMQSSYGSNPSFSQKRSLPGGLRVPVVDEELMRSSYGSNNQFTQIVLYYQQQKQRLKKQIIQLNQQIRQKQLLQKQINQLQKLISQKQQKQEQNNKQYQQKIRELQQIMDEMRRQLDLKQHQQMNQNDINDRAMMNQPYNDTIPNHIIQHPQHPQTSQFRTSIQPKVLLNQQQIFIINNKNNQIQQLKHLNNNLVNQFSQLSLQQNNQLISLKQQIDLKSQSINQLQNYNQQLLKINKELFEEQNLQFKDKLIQNQLDYQNRLQQQKQKLTNQLSNQYKQIEKQSLKKFIQIKQQYQISKQQYQKRISIINQKLKQKQSQFENIIQDNIEKQSELLKLYDQIKQLKQNLIINTENGLKDAQIKDNIIKKLEKSVKQAKDQCARLMNQNQTLAKQFNKLIKVDHQLETMTKKCSQLESANKNLHQGFTKLSNLSQNKESFHRNQGVQSPFSQYISSSGQRVSDLLQSMNPSSQQNFTINNISNIHAMVQQLGEDSFVLHEKQKQTQILKDLIQKIRGQNQILLCDNKQKQIIIIQLQDKLSRIQNSFNAQIMMLRKNNAELNSEILKLKKSLFHYQKENGDIQKFIQQNFLHSSGSSLQLHQYQQRPSLQQNRRTITKTNKNNSFHFESHHQHELSLNLNLTQNNKGNITHYYPKDYLQRNQQSTALNMGQMFMGKKTKHRNFNNNNTQNYSSLSQMFRINTSTFAHNNSNIKPKNNNTFAQVTTSNRPNTNYNKFLSEFDKYEEKLQKQKIAQPSYGAGYNTALHHAKKISDHKN